MSKMRKQFESWILSSKVCVSKGAVVKVRADGHYTDGRVDLQWKAWQASRAALRVELPSFENGSIRGYSGDCEEARMVVDAIAESLDEAGVRYE